MHQIQETLAQLKKKSLNSRKAQLFPEMFAFNIQKPNISKHIENHRIKKNQWHKFTVLGLFFWFLSGEGHR